MHRLLAIVAALVVLAGSSLFGIGAALGQLADLPSPAQGDASVIAQGVATMPTGESAWRVTLANAPAAAGLPARETPGFILVGSGTLLLEDPNTGRQTRLAASEAAFLPAGASVNESAPADQPVAFYRIDLVPPAAAGDPGADQMVFVGQPFASPGGSRDLDLVRDVMDAGEQAEVAIPAEAGPVLFLVSEGAVDLVPASDPAAEPVRLPAGQGAALRGNVIVSAADGQEAAFVMAVIGPDVAPGLAQEVAPTATPAPALASITVQALVCPAGYAGEDYAAECVEPAADVTFNLADPVSGAAFDATTGADGTVAFTDLEAVTYTLTGGVPGEFASQVVACADELGLAAVESAAGDVPGAAITLGAGSIVTCTWYVIPEDLRGETGSVAVTVHLCPGTPVDPFADCESGDATGLVIEGPVVLTTDESSAVPVSTDGVSWVWGEAEPLPFGTYSLQPGGIVVPDGYQLSEVRGSQGASDGGWTFTIDEATPQVILNVIYVSGAPPAGEIDTDQDGLLDASELEVGTDPALYDTDGDGYGDNLEVVSGTDPTDPASAPETGPVEDSDDDGLIDSIEAELGTDLGSADSDGDGLSDFEEVGFEPGSGTGTDPTLFDSDGDGVGDGDEIANGTDPLNASSF